MKQRTISKETSISGKSLHTGDEVTITFKPAPIDHGIVFRRVDLYGNPEFRPSIDQVTEVVRNTTLTSGHTKIHTVEHVLSALNGLSINNAIIEINGIEPPIMDGSAKEYVKCLVDAQPEEQDKEQEILELKEPVTVNDGNRSLVAFPYDGFRVTCTSMDDRGIHTQHLSIDIDPDSYTTQLAPARTFTIYEEIEELLKLGKIQGGSLDSAIVIKGDKILSKEPLRFKDEFVRHKILDIVGDVSLLGKPLKAHIIAVRPGHAMNARLTAEIAKSLSNSKKKKPEVEVATLEESKMDIRRIIQTMPHRYPFLMLDRVIEINDNSLVAIKNVTINEPFFQGHFPGHPVMPGVMQLEAMAQAAGVLMMCKAQLQNRVAFFMSADKVKFRRAVTPGDQVEIRVELLKTRGQRIATAKGECKVGGKVVSSSELMFTIADTE